VDQQTVLDIIPEVDYRNVPHCFDPTHTPSYSVEDQNGDVLAEFGSDIVKAVHFTHYSRNGYVFLCEDGIPVYESLS